MEPTDYEYDEYEYEYDEGPRTGSRILWGRIAVFAVALGLMFFLGRCTAGAGDAEGELAELEDRVSILLEENADLEAQLDAVAAGGVGDVDDADEAEVEAEEASDEEAEPDEGEEADEAEEADETADSADEPRIHEVQQGDSLYHIAEQYYGEGEEWRLIVRANGLDADDPQIRPGQQLEIPER